MDDSDLIQRLTLGDEEAFREVVERHQKLVLNCAFKFLRDDRAAEDLTQEVFVEVFESIRTFREEAQLSTWIYRIAVTKSLNVLKSQKRKKRFAAMVSLFAGPEPAHNVPGPDELLENSERASLLTRALQRLPENQRVAFTLSKVEGFSYAEVARTMGISVPSVESLIHRARMNLRKRLSAYYRQHLSEGS
jgi:RNA polymerase sigma-70 factor (ECF subfamily)